MPALRSREPSASGCGTSTGRAWTSASSWTPPWRSSLRRPAKATPRWRSTRQPRTFWTAPQKMSWPRSGTRSTASASKPASAPRPRRRPLWTRTRASPSTPRAQLQPPGKGRRTPRSSSASSTTKTRRRRRPTRPCDTRTRTTTCTTSSTRSALTSKSCWRLPPLSLLRSRPWMPPPRRAKLRTRRRMRKQRPRRGTRRLRRPGVLKKQPQWPRRASQPGACWTCLTTKRLQPRPRTKA
mmetsp:Transcript_11086/g.35310  ORF Transcript_11086/g.35310 Transcript_11086/m.35310 type:complete len:239 (+) Transcript_11086:866-1582(+)